MTPTIGVPEVLARSRMVRFDVLTLVTLGVLRAAGLETVPTFKSPQYTIMLPNLGADLRRLLACENAPPPRDCPWRSIRSGPRDLSPRVLGRRT